MDKEEEHAALLLKLTILEENLEMVNKECIDLIEENTKQEHLNRNLNKTVEENESQKKSLQKTLNHLM